MSYRFYDPAPVFFDQLGIQPLAGGVLHFYEIGTTTPRNTWSDPGMAIPNTNPVPLDSSGRANVNIWLDGAYTVILKSAAGTTIATRDVNAGTAAGASIPPLVAGLFLSNDGTNPLWAAIRQVPDPSGSTGKILGTDGTSLIWENKPEIPASNASSGPGFMKIGDYMVQWGRAQCPATGGAATSTSVTMPTTYTETPFVLATVARYPFYSPSYGGAGIIMARASSNNSFEVQMHSNIKASDRGSDGIVTAPVDFTWVAFGKVT